MSLNRPLGEALGIVLQGGGRPPISDSDETPCGRGAGGCIKLHLGSEVRVCAATRGRVAQQTASEEHTAAQTALSAGTCKPQGGKATGLAAGT